MPLDTAKLDSFAKEKGIKFEPLTITHEETSEDGCIYLPEEHDFSHIANFDVIYDNQIVFAEIDGVCQDVHGSIQRTKSESGHDIFAFSAYSSKGILAQMEMHGIPATAEGVKLMSEAGNLRKQVNPPSAGKQTSNLSFTSTWFFAAVDSTSIKKAYHRLVKTRNRLSPGIPKDTEMPGASFNVVSAGCGGVHATTPNDDTLSIPTEKTPKKIKLPTFITEELTPAPKPVEPPVETITEPAAAKKRGRRPKEAVPEQSEPSKRQRVPEAPRSPTSQSSETPEQRFEIILTKAKEHYEKSVKLGILHTFRNLWKPDEKFSFEFLFEEKEATRNQRILLYSVSIAIAREIKKKEIALDIRSPAFTWNRVEKLLTTRSEVQREQEALKKIIDRLTETLNELDSNENDMKRIQDLMSNKEMPNKEKIIKTIKEWSTGITKRTSFIIGFFEKMKEFSMKDMKSTSFDPKLFPCVSAIVYAMLEGLPVEEPTAKDLGEDSVF